ncbi:hypothetical protein IJ750_01960 [bacterium]|nr:hypothetical protein [bacterium]
MSIKPMSINFKNTENIKTRTDNTQRTAEIGAAAVLAAGGAIILRGTLSVKSLATALKKQGAELKDGIAIIKATGEKFTGTIKRNIGTFGYKRETIKYENGVMTEKIYHNIFGKELEGEFYKSGILRIKVGQGKNYSLTLYDSDGKCKSIADCRLTGGESKFENARNMIND